MLLGAQELAHSSHMQGCRHITHALAQGPSLTAGVGDGDGHTLDLDTIDVDGLHGLGRCRQLSSVQADDAPSRGDLWQGTLFPENCSRVFFAGPTRMGSTGCRAATRGGRGGHSCCWRAVLDKDRLHLTRRRTDVDLGVAREKRSGPQKRLGSGYLSVQCHLPAQVRTGSASLCTRVFPS